jgi:hypothetical protein
MNKLNTDLLLFILSIALAVFTFMGITDPKDFVAFIGMVASYKFGRAQGLDKPKDEVKPPVEELG